MCGIFGFWLKRKLEPADIALGRRGTSMLAHRGPDGSGEWVDAEIGLYMGHRRLAIIDCSEANAQPFVAHNGALIYNGELYNFREIRKLLKSLGHSFTTDGDTEVLHTAWAEWGAKALDHFDGMFAFALFDGQLLHLATDPFGEKPLFWAETGEGLYFASEAQVLTECLNLSFEPSQQEVTAFMALGYIPPPATGYLGLRAVSQANHLIIDKGRLQSQRRYWCPPEPYFGKGQPVPLNEKELDEIQATLLDSLRLRLRADVTVGLFLSGGVDSALIAALLTKELRVDVGAYTVTFPDGADESVAAARIAHHLGMPHQIIDSREDESWKSTPEELKSLYGIPNDNMTVMAMRQMSVLARQHITVAITGLGGDELFYGYGKYDFLYQRRYVYRYISLLVRILKPFENFLHFYPLWRSAVALLDGNEGWQYLSLKNNALGGILSELPSLERLTSELLPTGGSDLAFRVRDFDIGNTLPNSIIPPADRGSMRASLEVRTPFLSRPLLEVVSQLDQRSFLAYGQKSVLRRILARYLPEDLLQPGKQGFVYPYRRYLAQCHDETPAVRLLPKSLSSHAWSNRMSSKYERLALRLMLLNVLSTMNPLKVEHAE